MNFDLAQMSKSGGIYRTLALLSILSLKPAHNGKSAGKQSPTSEARQERGEVAGQDKSVVLVK